MVHVGAVGGLGPARVDDDNFPTPLLNGLEPVGHVGGGHDAAVGRDGIPADDEPVIRPVKVRHGHQQRMTKQLPGRKVVRKLVD